jgi:hypothetical protein
VFGMMGAVEVIVAETWTVDVQAWAIMGNVQDKRTQAQTQNPQDAGGARDAADRSPDPAAAAPAPAPIRLVIRGMVVMGTLVIRS